MEVIGEKLKASREEKGLSLNEVSEDLNIDMKKLEELESGNRDAFSDIFVLKKYIYDYAKYLGLDYEQLIEDRSKKQLLSYIDVLIDGRFVEELKDIKLKFRGSSNQRIINVQESLRRNKVVEYNFW